jgi:hypothetical protein
MQSRRPFVRPAPTNKIVFQAAGDIEGLSAPLNRGGLPGPCLHRISPRFRLPRIAHRDPTHAKLKSLWDNVSHRLREAVDRPLSARGTRLPQIWMTYEELAGMLGCTVAVAQERARVEQLDRKISRDGKKRAKLNAGLVAVFIARIKTMDLDIDQAVEELRHVHGLLEQADRPRRLASWLGLRKVG